MRESNLKRNLVARETGKCVYIITGGGVHIHTLIHTQILVYVICMSPCMYNANLYIRV